MMSVNMVSNISPVGGVRETHSATVGGSKPLHRFIRGEPKSIGIVMLFMGSSLFLLAIPMRMDPLESSAENFTSFWLGILFIICGLLYVFTEKNTSKQLVTASLALSIISILGVTVAFFEFLKGILNMQYYHYRYYYSYYDDITNSTRVDVPWRKHHTGQLLSLEAVFMYQSLVGMVFLIMMTAFARAALRSSKTQVKYCGSDKPYIYPSLGLVDCGKYASAITQMHVDF
uniref:membrane-spanning 4-domains subfamily A member 4A-like isoform X1 n=1 Tax=Oncorhynchus gorbuscha TaxID=8017 RepID=UPI001EAF3AEE|nr:membrane-spanning 4-domains subfamily A member 4A-like isoform X1 [Oncorhynchus gorbuscha]